MRTRFEWDDEKNRANQRKHGISFARATQVFDDPGVVFLDDRVVDGEERWQTIGLMEGIHLVLVVHTIRELGRDEVIRIISARKAMKAEEHIYEEHNGQLYTRNTTSYDSRGAGAVEEAHCARGQRDRYE